MPRKSRFRFDPDDLERFAPRYFILGGKNGHELIPADLMEWAHWFEEAGSDRQIALTGNPYKWVSTVFLGLDHRWFGDGPPLVFESMAFSWDGVSVWGEDSYMPGQPRTQELDMARYGSWKAAMAGHKRMVKKIILRQEKARAGGAEGDPGS